jgi:hypothetical protein
MKTKGARQCSILFNHDQEVENGKTRERCFKKAVYERFRRGSLEWVDVEEGFCPG